MGRRKYPSDHRRWFRVNEDILHDDKIASVGLEGLGLFIRILATLNWQKSKTGVCFLNRGAAATLAGRERWAYAEPAYSRLGAGSLVTWCYHGTGILVYVPNWLKIQELTPVWLRSDSDETPTTSPKTSPTPTPSTKNKSLRRASSARPELALEGQDTPTSNSQAASNEVPERWQAVSHALARSTYLTSPKLRDWAWWDKFDAIYPGDSGPDPEREIAKMDEWMHRNQQKARRYKDLKRFVSNWLARAAEEDAA